MKKIAIMTWYHYLNFGTALQVAASFYIIDKLGYKPDVIQYIPHGKLIKLQNESNIKYYIKKIDEKYNNIKNKIFFDQKRIDAFNKFLNKEITLTYECKTESDLFKLNDQYDAFVCGSDQIWSPSIFNPKYFLDFVKDSNKMIAYAPSIGVSKIQDKYILKRMEECIKRFKYLSIREQQGKKLIRNICGKQAITVLDPTLLLSDYEWDKKSDLNIIQSQYILCYFLGNNKQTWNHVKKLSIKFKLPIKIIPVFSKDLKRGYDVVDGVGPAQFLNLIKNATFVCTDSFHGTTFSVIYKKPFYTYERFSNKDVNSQNSRIYSILKLIGLEDRIVKDKSTINENALICNFEQSMKIIECEKKKSIKYLQESLYKSSTYSDKDKLYEITNTCCGCGACVLVCKKGAINVKRNQEGFLTAVVDKNRCTKCNICKHVCPYNGEKSNQINEFQHSLFMLHSKYSKILNVSSSGGAAHEIANMLCNIGYDVVGCMYNNKKNEAIHEIVKSGEVEKLYIFQGSKYIQSNTVYAFKQIINTSKKAVIFGTPCQIAGIDRVLKLKNKRNNFILVDLVCHGIPTYNLWNKYLIEGSIKYGYGLNPNVVFRDKNKGWQDKHINIRGNKKIYIGCEQKDMFYKFFSLEHCYMPSCYECQYRTYSAADIRLGDYWGPRYKKVRDGVSMVIVMSNIGEKILKRLKSENRIKLQNMNFREYSSIQNLQNPIKPVFYKELIDDLKDKSNSLKDICIRYDYKKFEFNNKLHSKYSKLRSIYNNVTIP